ncbi:UNVERIFIED_CONTAM: hypothetical protein FKN15_061040 [Acipenser sinensis]
MAYLDGALQSAPLPEPVASEIRLVSGMLLQISSFQVQALGRSLASLIVVRRQLPGCACFAGHAYLPWLYIWASSGGNPATLPPRMEGVLTGDLDALFPCSGAGEDETPLKACSLRPTPFLNTSYNTGVLDLRFLGARHRTHRLCTAVLRRPSSLSRNQGYICERPSPGLGPQARIRRACTRAPASTSDTNVAILVPAGRHITQLHVHLEITLNHLKISRNNILLKVNEGKYFKNLGKEYRRGKGAEAYREAVLTTLGAIKNTLSTAERHFQYGSIETGNRLLQNAKTNFDRISMEISENVRVQIPNCFHELMPVLENEGISDTQSSTNTGSDFMVQQRREGQFGLPRISVSRQQLQIFIARGYTGKRIDEHLGCSVSYIYKLLKAEGLSPRDKYSNFADSELDTEVKVDCGRMARSGEV